jgi:uncharacterized protein (TIRG00374 family)
MPAQQPAPATQERRKLLIGVVVSLVCLAIVLWFADLGQLIRAVQMANYGIVSLAFLVSFIWLLARGMVWRTLLQEKASYSHTLFSVAEGYLLNNFLPFRLGEVGRAYLLSQKARLDFWSVFSTIFIERTLDLAMAAGFLLVSLPFVIAVSWAQQAAIGAGLLVAIILLSLYLLARYQVQAFGLFERTAGRFAPLARLGSKSLPAFFQGLSVLTDWRLFLKALFWMLLNWGIALLQFYLFILAFFPEAKILWATFTMGVTALGIAAPSSPGALGVMEAAMVGALAVFKLDPSTALAVALSSRLSNYLLSGILGSYALARDGQSLTGLYDRVRQVASQA